MDNTDFNNEVTAGRRNPNRDRAQFASNAEIEELTTQRDTTYVTIVYDRNPEGGRGRGRRQEVRVRLVVTRRTQIFNRRGNPIRPSQLEVGMVINASFSQVMTRSIPPQAEAFQINVVSRGPQQMVTIGRIVEVNVRGRFIITTSGDGVRSLIRFNITPETVIRGRFRQIISLNDLFPGLRVRVEHASFMTASIPPQTTAFSIQVIS